MRVKDLLEDEIGFEAVTIPDPEREITGGYCGDLLSWVMGKAKEGNAWFTIMSNINIVAVATLTDVACIVVTEGVQLSEEIVSTATQKGVNILSTTMDTFMAATFLSFTS